MKSMVLPIVAGALITDSKWFLQEPERLEIRGWDETIQVKIP